MEKRQSPWGRTLRFWGWFILLGLACSLPEIGGGGGATRTLLPTPTPLGEYLVFQVPTYRVDLSPGDTVPGTRLRYIGQNGTAYDVTIDGLPALKRSGDSFAWTGIIAPGVQGRYNLRLATTIFGQLTATGPIELNIFKPTPVSLPTSVVPTAPLHFDSISVRHRIIEGGVIPGTTLIYTGYVEQSGGVSQRMARLGGTSGYPFVALNDSLTWYGQIRDSVIIRYDLRVTAIDDNGLSLQGTADLWVQPRK